jgi:hypothetical protein
MPFSMSWSNGSIGQLSRTSLHSTATQCMPHLLPGRLRHRRPHGMRGELCSPLFLGDVAHRKPKPLPLDAHDDQAETGPGVEPTMEQAQFRRAAEVGGSRARRGVGGRGRSVPPALPGDLPAHLQCAPQHRLHPRPCLMPPGGRGPRGADMEGDSWTRQEARRRAASMSLGADATAAGLGHSTLVSPGAAPRLTRPGTGRRRPSQNLPAPFDSPHHSRMIRSP